MLHTVRNLMASLIDYAGLFPPAQLDMGKAVQNYASYRRGEHAWMLGRFVVPSARLDEFEAVYDGEAGWQLSALAPAGAEADLRRILEFNRKYAGRAAIDSIEVKAADAATIGAIAARVPRGLTAYFEIPVDNELFELLRAISEAGGRAKIRLGGATPDKFMPAADLAHFLRLRQEAGVPFKATAGLHHALPTDSPSGPMHGFMNVFLAAALIEELSPARTEALLTDDGRTRFRFEPNVAYWRDMLVTADALRRAREDAAISFGSCSFEEPVADLRDLGLV